MRALLHLLMIATSVIAPPLMAENENPPTVLSVIEKRKRVEAFSRCLITDYPAAASDLAIFMYSYSDTPFKVPKSDCVERTETQGLLTTVALYQGFLDVYALSLAQCFQRSEGKVLADVRRKFRRGLPEEQWQDSALGFIKKHKGLGNALNSAGQNCVPNYEKLMANNTNLQRRVLVHLIRDWQTNA